MLCQLSPEVPEVTPLVSWYPTTTNSITMLCVDGKGCSTLVHTTALIPRDVCGVYCVCYPVTTRVRVLATPPSAVGIQDATASGRCASEVRQGKDATGGSEYWYPYHHQHHHAVW